MSRPWIAPLMAWYGREARILPWRDLPLPYNVWVSEIMLQQTRVEAVIPYFRRFMTALPNVAALAAAEEETLLKLWEGLGYYSRVRNLQKAAQQIMERFGGALPADLSALKSLPGIGDYTAGAIASIAFGLPAAAVDGNVLRVISRMEGKSEDIALEKTKKDMAAFVESILPADAGRFNQALMELGAVVCVPNGAPRCEVCPAAEFCVAHKEGKTHLLPVKSPKKPRKVEKRCVFVLVCEGKVALEKRPKKGLLSGLWQFPSCAEGEAFPFGAKVLDLQDLPPTKHIFTHVEWHMENALAAVEAPFGPYEWLLPEEIDKNYALPSAFRGVWQEAKRRIEG